MDAILRIGDEGLARLGGESALKAGEKAVLSHPSKVACLAVETVGLVQGMFFRKLCEVAGLDYGKDAVGQGFLVCAKHNVANLY